MVVTLDPWPPPGLPPSPQPGLHPLTSTHYDLGGSFCLQLLLPTPCTGQSSSLMFDVSPTLWHGHGGEALEHLHTWQLAWPLPRHKAEVLYVLEGP